jgi:hypothetical protein
MIEAQPAALAVRADAPSKELGTLGTARAASRSNSTVRPSSLFLLVGLPMIATPTTAPVVAFMQASAQKQ